MQKKFGRALFKKRAKMKLESWINYANDILSNLKKLNDGDKSVISEFLELEEKLGFMIKYTPKLQLR